MLKQQEDYKILCVWHHYRRHSVPVQVLDSGTSQDVLTQHEGVLAGTAEVSCTIFAATAPPPR